MKSRTYQSPLALDYIALIGLWIVWVTFLLNAQPYQPSSPFQNFHSPIHDARPVLRG